MTDAALAPRDAPTEDAGMRCLGTQRDFLSASSARSSPGELCAGAPCAWTVVVMPGVARATGIATRDLARPLAARRHHHSADVVIVGGGAAGLATAFSASGTRPGFAWFASTGPAGWGKILVVGRGATS
jgi:hypothetical protein